LSATRRSEIPTVPVRDRLVARNSLEGHDGASGARLERATLSDGSTMILKQFNPKHDLTMRLAENDEPMEIRLWQAGILDLRPPGVTHCVVDAWMEDGYWILAMRDLGQSMLGWESSIGREECCRVLAGRSSNPRPIEKPADCGSLVIRDSHHLFLATGDGFIFRHR
jgi:hypothetical protein